MGLKTYLYALATACLMVSQSGTAAKAVESIAVAGPVGGSDIGAGFLPQDGIWVSGVAASVKFSDYFLPNGDKVKASGSDNVAGIGMLWVYPGEYWGGKLASSVFLGGERVCFGMTKAGEYCKSGIKDMYSDVLVWSRFFPGADITKQTANGPFRPYGTAFLTGLGVTFPTGKYNVNDPMNNGSNFWGFSPSIGVTHTIRSPLPEVFGDAMEFSGRLFYHYYTENKDSRYKTGSVVSLDWAITMAKGNFKYGLSGLTYQQLENDKINGVNTPNTRSRVFGLGPIISYDFTSGKRPVNLTIKTIHSMGGANVVKSDGIFMRLSTKF